MFVVETRNVQHSCKTLYTAVMLAKSSPSPVLVRTEGGEIKAFRLAGYGPLTLPRR